MNGDNDDMRVYCIFINTGVQFLYDTWGSNKK